MSKPHLPDSAVVIPLLPSREHCWLLVPTLPKSCYGRCSLFVGHPKVGCGEVTWSLIETASLGNER